MPNKTFENAAIMVALTTVLAIGGYEFFLRQAGHTIGYDDSESLFADKFRHIHRPSNEVVVFTGSSRIKYDLQTDLWQELTGTSAIQLANVGSGPHLVLQHLAADPQFKGKLIVDVVEALFYDVSGRGNGRPSECLKFAASETPAQRFSFHLNTVLESNFVFLDKDNFALSGLLDGLPIPPRPGKMGFPKYPTAFQHTNFARQNSMTDQFVDNDTAGVKMMQDIWMGLAQMGAKAPPMPQHVLDSLLLDVKKHTDAIKSRGGEVVFVRPPSSGPLWQGEQAGFPRDRFWNALLQTTGCKGIHFADYDALKNLQCTEFSHLRISDGQVFTRKLVEVLKTEIGWTFK
jgi:hypothetical protein